jgi:hypothetical protein
MAVLVLRVLLDMKATVSEVYAAYSEGPSECVRMLLIQL